VRIKSLSRNLSSGLFPCSVSKGKMEQGFVVDRFLLPADQNPPEAIHPRGDAFDHPASSATALGAFRGLLFAARLDMGRIAATAGFCTNDCRIESFIAAQMLPAARSRTRTTDRNAVQRRAEKSLIMYIGTVDCQPQGHAAAIGQHRALDPQFAPIRGIGAGFFPRPREPWLSSRPDFATSTGCPAGHRTAVAGTSKARGTRRVAPIPGNSGATNCLSQTRGGPLSIGRRCAGRRKCRRQPCANPVAAGLPAGTRDTWARTAPCEPRAHWEYANSDTFVQRACENPP
jgi:hypothetical protein